MPKIKNQSGFTGLETVLILVIVGLLGFTGWYVYNAQKNANKNYAQTNASKTSVKKGTKKSGAIARDPYAGWATYTSKSAGYTVKYPSGWTIEGYTNGQGGPTPASQLTGNEDSMLLFSSTAKNNSFGIWLNKDTQLRPAADGDGGGIGVGLAPYSDGSIIKTLPNGMNIWSLSQSKAISGVGDFEVVTNGQFGYKLSNGTYLQISMGFGYAFKQTTDYSYNQQVNSPLLIQAENILSSLSSN